MSARSDLREGDEVVDVHGLVAAATDMSPYFIAIAGLPWDGEGTPPIRVGDGEADAGSLNLDVQFRASRGTFEHRFIASVVFDGYQLVADVGVRVEVPDHIRPTRRALDEYGARVAMFSAYPFVREAMFSLATRFELGSFSLPILRQPDDIEVDAEDADEPFPLDDEGSTE